MKIKQLFFVMLVTVLTYGCSRVAPNYYGVLMDNYGKSGKSDYSKVSGRVSEYGPGTELFQVPAWEQRASFTNDDKTDKVLHLKSSDNTEFSSKPSYSYKSIESKVVDLVFQNSRLGSGDGFMRALEDNVLEPRIYDIIKEESRKYTTDTLMAQGGSLLFEQRVQLLIKASFENSGLELVSFSSNLDFSAKVKEKIDARNEVNTNLSVLDQQIIEQKKRNELVELQTQELLIRSKGLTSQILQEKWIEAWKITKQPIYGGQLPTFFKNVQ